MEIITTMSGYRLTSPFPKPQAGDVHCLVQLKDGVLTRHINGAISEVAESTNSDRAWAVRLADRSPEAEFSTIGSVRGYPCDTMSITCTEDHLDAAEDLLDRYLLVKELAELRLNRSKLRQSQTSVKLYSNRIDNRKVDK
ncbi:hypothetical protein MYOV003v1_p0084 [Vibrio phage 207E48.1]|nr:hypothetical protein MYOV003v1_p0084 [Vibrio phage 207E48.1]